MENKITPHIVNVEPGTHYLCTCGTSARYPFCDGNHKGTEFTPHIENVSEAKTLAICTCKQSASGIFCDGSHLKQTK